MRGFTQASALKEKWVKIDRGSEQPPSSGGLESEEEVYISCLKSHFGLFETLG